MNPDTAITFLDFVVERHRVWERRQAGQPAPWTEDPILRSRKFTHVYRVLDYGSQFLVNELLNPLLSPRDALARCFLYRYTNLPATWTEMQRVMGRYPLEQDLNEVLVKIIHEYRDAGNKVFSGAYMILPQPNREGDKVQQAVELAARWMESHAGDFMAATTQSQRYEILRREYGVGPFLAMQILTDWGYSEQCGEDRENEFIIPGPGCIKGAKRVDSVADATTMIYWARDSLYALDDCPRLNGRRPSLMDVQNCWCEFSKYMRLVGKDQPYTALHKSEPPTLPRHWSNL